MTEGTPHMSPTPRTGAQAGSPPAAEGGTKDGRGAGDRDQPYHGFRPYQFSTRQLARLLLLRGEALEARLGRGRFATDVAVKVEPSAADIAAKVEAALDAEAAVQADT